MKNWEVFAIVDATQVLGVFKEETGEEAICKGYEQAAELDLGLCHVCANKVDVGEVVSLVAYCEDTEEEVGDGIVDRLNAEIERLEGVVETLQEASPEWVF